MRHQKILDSTEKLDQSGGTSRERNQCVRLVAVLVLLALLTFACGGCLAGWLNRTALTTPEIQYPASTRSSQATPAVTSLPAGISVTPAPTGSSADYAAAIQRLLLAGLQDRQREIVLDYAIANQEFPEADVQSIIDLVFQIYQGIYLEYPEFYYLNGSINVSYSVLKSDPPVLKGMTVKPLYWEITDKLTDNELDSLLAQIDHRVGEMAAAIEKQTSVPWQQLQMLHDKLVLGIAYDTSGDVESNQVISALLDGTTLCQGYARSFQLVASRLGFEVKLISGESEGVGHLWDLVKLGGLFYHVDVTHDDPTPDAGSNASIQHVNFLRSDNQMKKTHIWEYADYPACTSDGAQYYRENGLTAGSRQVLKDLIGQFCGNLDYSSSQTSLLELLYTGNDLPQETELEKIVESALQEASGGTQLHYRYQIVKSVILIEISTGS